MGRRWPVDFWATWCGPCMAELSHVLEAYQACHDQGFEILGISLDRRANAGDVRRLGTAELADWLRRLDPS